MVILLRPYEYTPTPPPPDGSGRPTYLHDIIVDLDARALYDAEVSLQVTPAGVVVSFGVVRGAVEENAGASVVLHEVVVHNRPKGGQAK